MGKSREYHQAMLHYVRKEFNLADLTTAVAEVIGTLPIGAVVVDAGCHVSVAFDSGTSDLADMGTVADPNGFMTVVSVATIGQKKADELATSNDLGPYSAETDVVVTVTRAGTAATVGTLQAWVAFMVDNDQ